MTTETVPAPRPSRGATAYLALAAGALFVVVPLLVQLVSDDAFALMGVAGLLFLAALPGIRRAQHGRDGRSGAWGLRLTMTGLGALVVLVLSGDLIDASVDGAAQDVAETMFLLVGALAGVATMVGVVLFSLGMTRARVFPAAAIWVFLGGLLVALVSEGFEQALRGPVPWLADTLPPLGFVVAGVGLLAIGRSARDQQRA